MLVTQTTKNAFFFEKFYRGHDPPHPQSCLYTPPVRAACIPRRWRPQPQRIRTDCTAQAAGQAVPEPGQTSTRAYRRPNAGHAAPVCTRYQTGHAGQIVTAAGCWVCPKLCRCGQHDFAIFYQKNKSEKSYIFIQKGLTYKIYLI